MYIAFRRPIGKRGKSYIMMPIMGISKLDITRVDDCIHLCRFSRYQFKKVRDLRYKATLKLFPQGSPRVLCETVSRVLKLLNTDLSYALMKWKAKFLNYTFIKYIPLGTPTTTFGLKKFTDSSFSVKEHSYSYNEKYALTYSRQERCAQMNSAGYWKKLQELFDLYS